MIVILSRIVCFVLFLTCSSRSESFHPSSSHDPVSGMIWYHEVAASGYTVTYDERSFLINDNRTIILSGSVHYPRSTPGMWDHIFEEMVKDGLNAVEIYVFWNIHEFKRGQDYDFTGPANLPLFIEKAAKAGLFVNLRIGPYVCAEWNYGGLPVWLNSIPGMSLRSDSPVWEKEMERFVTDITKITEKYLARNGGPIILAQIENEYHWPEYMDYINWCGELVAKLDLGIPWVMCNGLSANNTINTCNGNDCQKYAQNHIRRFPGQPLAWTENEGWFQQWSFSYNAWADRTPEDMAYVILAWFARGGAHHNYYMWYGGNHMGRWVASGIANKYADGVNLHSDMLPNEPKRTHLTRLHNLISDNSAILLGSKIQADSPEYLLHYSNKTNTFVNGTQQMAFVYDNDAGRIVFVQNSAPVEAIVLYSNLNIMMQPLSIVVLDKSNSVLFDSSKVNSTGLRTRRKYILGQVTMDTFAAWSETTQEATKMAITKQYPAEQLLVTQDESDYLFYHAKISIPVSSDNAYIAVDSRTANSLLVFINGRFQGAADNHDHISNDITMGVGLLSPINVPFNLTILSVSLGLDNGVFPGFVEKKGIVGNVYIGETKISNTEWLHRPKLTGEIQQVYTSEGSQKISWDSDISGYLNVPLTWFKTTFTIAPYTSEYSLLLKLAGFTRGHYYVNGVDLGRYWLIEHEGKQVQEYYFVPPDIVNYNGPNLLVIGEELGASDPTKAILVLSTMTV